MFCFVLRSFLKKDISLRDQRAREVKGSDWGEEVTIEGHW